MRCFSKRRVFWPVTAICLWSTGPFVVAAAALVVPIGTFGGSAVSSSSSSKPFRSRQNQLPYPGVPGAFSSILAHRQYPIATTRLPATPAAAASSSINNASLRKTKKIKASDTKAEGRKRLASAMAFVTGWANMALFTSPRLRIATMMTGNALWMSLACAEQRYLDMAYFASFMLAYVSGVGLFRRIDLSLRQNTLPVCAALVAALLVGGDAWHYLIRGNSSVVIGVTQRSWIPMIMFATAFGMANSLGSEVCGTLTFVITGHITRMANALVDRVSRTAGRKPLDGKVWLQNGSVVVSFLAGAVWAGWLKGCNRLHRFGNFAVIGMLFAVMWLLHDMESLGGAWWLRKNGEMCENDDDGRPCQANETNGTN